MLIKKFLENMCNVLKIICTLRKEKNIQHRIHVYIYIYIYIYLYIYIYIYIKEMNLRKS